MEAILNRLGIRRTKTYIAGDWDSDRDAVEQLHKWNDNNYWGLSFVDVHSLTNSNDGSLNCSIKASLKTRMDVSKRFVLIVGDKTNTVTAGACYYCMHYDGVFKRCRKGYSVNNLSYVQYECQLAVNAGINILILYKSTVVDKSKCPLLLKNIGVHIPMLTKIEGKLYWDYREVKKAFDMTN